MPKHLKKRPGSSRCPQEKRLGQFLQKLVTDLKVLSQNTFQYIQNSIIHTLQFTSGSPHNVLVSICL